MYALNAVILDGDVQPDALSGFAAHIVYPKDDLIHYAAFQGCVGVVQTEVQRR